MLKIVTTPNSILTTPSKKVKKIDNNIKNLVEEMKKTLVTQKDPEGVGLAAPQVGVNLSLFIIKPNKKSPIEVFINPKILKTEESQKKSKKKEKRIKLEGCLSIPKIWGKVQRKNKILVQYQDLNGNIKTEWFSGFKAIIIQHEIDHLQGILFTQRALNQKQRLFQEKDGKLMPLELI